MESPSSIITPTTSIAMSDQPTVRIDADVQELLSDAPDQLALLLLHVTNIPLDLERLIVQELDCHTSWGEILELIPQGSVGLPSRTRGIKRPPCSLLLGPILLTRTHPSAN